MASLIMCVLATGSKHGLAFQPLCHRAARTGCGRPNFVDLFTVQEREEYALSTYTVYNAVYMLAISSSCCSIILFLLIQSMAEFSTFVFVVEPAYGFVDLVICTEDLVG